MIGRLRDRAHRLSSALGRWLYRRQGMTIGEQCLISRTAKLDKTHPQGVHIGDYTAVAFGAAILTHDFVNERFVDTFIGSNCFIGAHSMIMPGVRIGDHCIVGSGSVVYTDVPANTVVAGNPARVVESGIVTGRWGIRNPQFLAKNGIALPEKRDRPIAAALPAKAGLERYFPGVQNPAACFEDLGLDSFALIALRAEIETEEKTLISDEVWSRVRRPIDIVPFLTMRKEQAEEGPPAGAAMVRHHVINMPQMAMKGLSESWLFKEIGDMHWSALTAALGVKSRDIADERGERLYATFTRIRYRSDAPLAAFRENDELSFSGEMTRYGAGMFFSTLTGRSDAGTLRIETMSSFSKFGQAGDNGSLIKSQPRLPERFGIPAALALPDFAAEYRALRAAEHSRPIFSTDYELVPAHDINGVGLLYFAAYPVIAEICLSRFLKGKGRWSPLERDCCYFANSGEDQSIRFDLLSFEVSGDTAVAVSTLTRQDGVRMALVRTTLAQVEAEQTVREVAAA